jgi:methyl-accepting chemotaxis protein
LANTNDDSNDGRSKPKRATRRKGDSVIDTLTRAIKELADGKPDAKLPDPGDDPTLAPLLREVARLRESARAWLREAETSRRMQQLVQPVTGATAEILATTRQQSAAASEQAGAVNEITTTLQELNEVAVQNVEKAESIIQIAEQSEQISQDGQRDVVATVEEIDRLRQQVGMIATKILDLTERTQQISEIISSVNEIAEQSKLLALNAAIEAAKAGEHGRGFAVVALEIRTLAEQSKQATRQVRTILSEIQKASHSAALVTEEGSKAATEGSAKVRRIGERLGQLVYVITQTTRASRQITAAMKQQSVGLDQIADAMKQINRATHETKLSVEQVEGALRRLDGLAKAVRTAGSDGA